MLYTSRVYINICLAFMFYFAVIYSWLYKEGSVISYEEDPDDTEKLIVEVAFTPASYAKFKSKFSIKL